MKRSAVPAAGEVDALIAAGWRPLGPDIGPVAVHHSRRRFFDYMTAVHGLIAATLDFPKIAFAKAKKSRRRTDGN